MLATARLASSGKSPIKTPLRAWNRNREFGVVRATFNRFGPLAGLTLGLVAMVGSIGVLGFVAIKLF